MSLCLSVSLSLYFSVSASFSSNMYAVALNPSCHIERLIEVHPLFLSISLSLCFSTFHVHTSCECFPMFTLQWTNCLKSIFEISCLFYFRKPDVNRKS
jgi:hypothetical protein